MADGGFFNSKPKDVAPRRLADFPDYVLAENRRRDMRTTRVTIQEEIARIRLTLEGENSDDKAVEAAARAMLEGRAVPAVVDPTAALAAAEQRLEVAKMAEAIALRDMSDLRAAYSRELCQSVAPEHRRVVRRIAGHLIALLKACAEEAEVRRSLGEDGTQVSPVLLPAMYFPAACGDGSGRGISPAEVWLATACRLGFLEENERTGAAKMDLDA